MNTIKKVLNEINIFQEELLYIVDDCMNDWSYVEKKYNEKFEELKDKLKELEE
jgi:hypothetical protein